MKTPVQNLDYLNLPFSETVTMVALATIRMKIGAMLRFFGNEQAKNKKQGPIAYLGMLFGNVQMQKTKKGS